MLKSLCLPLKLFGLRMLQERLKTWLEAQRQRWRSATEQLKSELKTWSRRWEAIWKFWKEWKSLISSQSTCIPEMWLKNSTFTKSKRLSPLPGFPNSSSTGTTKTTTWPRDRCSDSNGKRKRTNTNASSELSTGLGSTATNTLETH